MGTRAREASEVGEEGRATGKKENGSDKGEARAGLSDLREGGVGGGREREKERDGDDGKGSERTWTEGDNGSGDAARG